MGLSDIFENVFDDRVLCFVSPAAAFEQSSKVVTALVLHRPNFDPRVTD